MNVIRLLGPLYSRSKLACVTVAISTTLLGVFYSFVNRILDGIPDPESMNYQIIKLSSNNLVFVLILASLFCLFYISIYPFEKKKAESLFYSIGLYNFIQQVPIFHKKQKDSDHPYITQYEFINPGISLASWENEKAAIEAAFDLNIISIEYSQNKTRIIIRAVPSKYNLPTHIIWQDKYLSEKDSVLNLGEGFTGPVTIDLDKTPHLLSGGATGSGKSVLLKLILAQALKKGAEVYIADFKGGVDFPNIWHKQCHMCFDEDELIKVLIGLIEELEFRKKLLKERGCTNLPEYNGQSEFCLGRIILAVDEVAEIFDRSSGSNKARKEKINLIENKMSIIARQGRAFGISLFLSTQRPDASLIPGQIRTNMGVRICGRADQILSQIILDSSEAAEKIPKDAQGRFLLHDGTLFQSYWINDESFF